MTAANGNCPGSVHALPEPVGPLRGALRWQRAAVFAELAALTAALVAVAVGLVAVASGKW